MAKLLSQLYPITAGVQGTAGFGIQGNQGTIGLQGDQGVQGLSNQGVQGTIGLQGDQGTIGLQGDQGVQGLQGLSNQGVQGTIGLQGDQGVQGLQGDQGVQGTMGIQGEQGVQGLQGLSNQGIQGLQGLKGDAGTSISIVGNKALTPGSEQSELNDTGNSWYPAQIGDSVIDSLTGNLWVYNGTTWENVGLVRGPQGTQGVQGLANQGVQGLQGTFGDQGVQGIIGSQGVQGIFGNQGLQGNIGTTFNYSVVGSSQTLASNQGYIIDTGTYGAMTLTLPASPTPGEYINFQFTRGSNNNLTIARNGVNINGVAEDLVCDVSANFSLIYGTEASVGWRFVPNSGLTTPVIKIYKATWLGPYAQSGTADNLGNNSRVPYNTNSINTDTATFGGLQSPGSKTLTSIHIKTTGYYKIESNLHLFDQAEDRNLYVQLWTFDSVNNDLLRTAISDYRGPGTASDNDLIIKGDYIINITQPNTYIYIVVNHNFPGDGPYPSDNDSTSGGSTAPPELTITKLA